MVAEGPAVKMFDRLQQDMIEDDLELLFRVVGRAVEAGRLPADALEAIDIRATAPTLAVQDRLRNAQADQILLPTGPCRRRRWRCATDWTRARSGSSPIWRGDSGPRAMRQSGIKPDNTGTIDLDRCRDGRHF